MSIYFIKTTHLSLQIFLQNNVEKINKLNFERSSPNQPRKTFIWMTSENQVKNLINIATRLLQLLFNKRFRLAKWTSNSQTYLDQLPTADLEINKDKI